MPLTLNVAHSKLSSLFLSSISLVTIAFFKDTMQISEKANSIEREFLKLLPFFGNIQVSCSFPCFRHITGFHVLTHYSCGDVNAQRKSCLYVLGYSHNDGAARQ